MTCRKFFCTRFARFFPLYRVELYKNQKHTVSTGTKRPLESARINTMAVLQFLFEYKSASHLIT